MSQNFIEMISEIHGQRYLVQFQNIVNSKIPCGLFCTFNVPENLENIIAHLKKLNVNLKCICVVSESQKLLAAAQKGGGYNDNTPDVVSIEELNNYTPKPQVMFHLDSTSGPAFYDYFRRFNIKLLTLADFNITEAMYIFYIRNLQKLYNVYQRLADEESKKVFCSFIKGKLTLSVGDFRYAPEPQYFLEGFLPVKGDIAIDGGAYDGATARDFSMQGAKVYAFEMSQENYQNCLKLAKKYNFTMENLGLSNQEGQEFYTQGGAASVRGRGNIIGNFINLDTYVNRKNLPRVDYIKLDIEGAELDMLHGAAKTISRWKPKMAVSAYHKWEDLFTLAEYIISIRSDYEFKFRHYKMDCTDYVLTDDKREILHNLKLSYFLPTVAESVLYCR